MEKNQIFNKTYREIKSQLALNGVDYFLKYTYLKNLINFQLYNYLITFLRKEESLLDIQSIAKDNHENARVNIFSLLI